MEPILLDKPVLDAILTWDPILAPGIDRYRIRRELPDAAGWDVVGDSPSPPFEVRGLVPDRPIRFAVSPVFSDGTEPPESAWQTARVVPSVPEDGTEKPGTVQAFTVAQNGPALTFAWRPAVRPGTAAVEIRMGSASSPSWDASILVARVPDFLGSFVWPWLYSGTYTFYARGVDAFGRFSEADASVALTITPVVDHVLMSTEDEDGSSWPGTLADVAVPGGGTTALFLGEKPATADAWDDVADTYAYSPLGPYLPSGTYETVPFDNGVVEVSRIECEILASTPWGPATTSLSTQPASKWKFVPRGLLDDVNGFPYRTGRRLLLDRYFASGQPIYSVDLFVEIAISTTNTGTLGSVVWGPWLRFVPGEYRHRWRKFRLTLRGDGFSSPRVQRLRFYRRRRNVKIDGTVTLTGTGPASVTFGSDVVFHSTPFVTATLVGSYSDGGLAAEITNKSTTGFDVEVFDDLGNSVAVDLDWHAMGT